MNKKTLRLEAVHGPADGCVLEVPSDALSVTVLGESCVPPRVHVYQRVRESNMYIFYQGVIDDEDQGDQDTQINGSGTWPPEEDDPSGPDFKWQ